MNHKGKYLPLGLVMSGSLLAASQAWALPLGGAFYNAGTDTEARMRQIAQTQADTERTIFKSTKQEQETFQGFFIPASNTTKLAVLSDDGVTIDIDNVITNVQNAGKGQHGPDLAQSLFVVNSTFQAGRVYRISIDYSNTVYSGDGDLDGMTLFAYDGGGRVQQVNLIVSNGQDGAPVEEDAEETVGAFTVANRNDTDGDGVIDNSDNNVTATAAGRNEVDLMALDITRPAGPATDKVSVRIAGGRARLWQTATKGTLVPSTNGVAQFALSDLPKRIWLEATTTSAVLRDVAVELDYKGDKDTVKATGVWADLTATAHDNRSAANLFADPIWQDTPTPPRDRIELSGGVGLRPIDATNGARNVILMQYTVRPIGIENVPFVKFDVTRQIAVKNYGVDGPIRPIDEKAFPATDEQPNDDDRGDVNADDVDESDTPTATGHFYSEDRPGINGPEAQYRDEIFRLNALEFIRITFNGTSAEGNVVGGSRGSDKFAWHTRHAWHIDANTGWYRRTTGDAAESAENDIGPGHINLEGGP